MGLFSKIFGQGQKKAETKPQVQNTEPKEEAITKEEIEKIYEILVNCITNKDEKVLAEVKDCITATVDYAEKHQERYEMRGIDIVQDEEELQWIGLVDILIENGYAEEFDWKCEKEEFELLFKLRQFEKLYPTLSKPELDETGNIESWCSVIDRKWKADKVCVAQLDIDSDSYVVFPIDKSILNTVSKKAGEIGQVIKQIIEADPVKCEEGMISHVFGMLKKETEKEFLQIKLNTEAVGLTDSKFGGLPYLPKGTEPPADHAGNQLRLLAQIRMEDLPENGIGLPTQGVLQFWTLDDDLVGMNTGAGHKVVYYDAVDDTVTEEEIKEIYEPYNDGESYFPFQDEFGITFILNKEGISTSDYQFDKKFVTIWNQEYPGNEIGEYFELNEEMAADMYNELCGEGHKIGGYPMFTQFDPRDGEWNDYQTLLLQIDSFGVDGKTIMWGDAGVANFFINPADLKVLNFSQVLYTWDCG